MARRRLLVFALFLACRPGASSTPRAVETVELPPPPPLAIEEFSVIRATFDAGRTEIEIPTVRCDDNSPMGATRIFPPPTWKVKATPELLALDDPASELRVYISPYDILLGPPGFGCRSFTVSSGSSLAIVPADQVNDDPVDHTPLTDELVRVERICWCLSGTFAATTLASRVFHVTLHDELQRVFAEGWIDPKNFPTTPYPGELVAVDGLHASYVDPPGVTGIASNELFLQPNGDPIQGSLFVDVVDDRTIKLYGMTLLAVRLRAERDPLIVPIIADFDARMREDLDDPLFRSLPRCTEDETMAGPHCRH